MDNVVSLPYGNKPKPVPFPHFPSTLHAVIWRNWDVVDHKRIAATLQMSVRDVVSIGQAMGLPAPQRLTNLQRKRIALTIIRRSWHLLPYNQLLQLLDWTAAELEFTLREDDFLYVKLGNHKPDCSPVVYRQQTQRDWDHCARIKAAVTAAFPDGLPENPQPLFQFVDELSHLRAKTAPKKPSTLSPRYCYSYFALYGDPLLTPELDPYPAGYTAELARTGVDGVWLQAVLQKLAPYPFDPARADKHEARLKSLNALTKRLAKQGIKLWLYLNEPRAMPNAFFTQHPDLKGVTEGDWTTLCTSTPAVREWLTSAIKTICTAAPDLGGFFTISGSENLTHCWSHGQGASCQRCAKLGMPSVVAELHKAIQQGIDAAGHGQRLIAWDWGWPDAGVKQTIEALPKEIAVMSVSEWDTPIRRGGIDSTIGEYSVTITKPGPRATRHWSIANATGHKSIAKMQAATSWEMSAVPYIPCVRLAAEHAAAVKNSGVSGMMLGWTLGGYPSPNLAVIGEIGNGVSPKAAMATVAEKRNGREFRDVSLELWDSVSDAMQEFPFHISTVYQAPLQHSIANPLWLNPTGYRSTMVGFGYDDIDGWRAVYPPDVFADQLMRVAQGITSAVDKSRSLPNISSGLQQDLRYAAAVALAYGSVADQTRFYMLRRAGKLTSRAAAQILENEHARAIQMLNLQAEDACIGFEASNQYYFLRMDLLEKVINIAHLQAELGKSATG
ncbi:MAG: hypothetical protein ACKO14_05220 [Armatimonadota bacterium]